MATGTALVWGVVTFLAEGFGSYKLNEKLRNYGGIMGTGQMCELFD